jgi:hypothetical protein
MHGENIDRKEGKVALSISELLPHSISRSPLVNSGLPGPRFNLSG